METYDIKFNPRTFGLYCFFEFDGQQFYADLCDVPYSDYMNECMIFASENGQVSNWSDLYCKRNIPITKKALTECIEDFKAKYNKGE